MIRLPAAPLRGFASLAIVLFAGAIFPVLLDAVLVAPHAVFISHRQRTGQVVLVNTGTQPEEVTIELKYGYPATDSLGNIHVRLIDEPSPDEPSAAGWIRAFPRSVRVEPGQRQVVRLLGSPPADLPDGEYWSRLIVTSRGAQLAVAGADSAIQAGVVLEIETIISVTYRKGEVATGVRLRNFSSRTEGDSLVTWMHLEREGNAAFLGTARFVLRDGSGSEVHRWEVPTAVYHELNRRFAFPIDSVPAGDYTLHFRLDTDRADLDDSDVLDAEPLERSVAVEVGGR